MLFSGDVFWMHAAVPFLIGWLADRMWGDPVNLPHPVVWFGKAIASGEKKWNQGTDKVWKGGLMSVGLIVSVYMITNGLLHLAGLIHPVLHGFVISVGVFYCLAGKTLIDEVREVFYAVDRSLEEGRVRVGRIVGRDTTQLSAQEIRTAALETLAENLSDGVIAPMFWFLLLGLPGMMAYKMVNTLDSMIGYKNERYLDFGRIAARIDDMANYIPARLTSFLMLAVSGNWAKRDFVLKYGRAHASPNSGYPESALAAILDCRFGGTHDYFGKPVAKPYIGEHERDFTTEDMQVAIRVNNRTEMVMGMIVLVVLALF